jgi:hypothetical protein
MKFEELKEPLKKQKLMDECIKELINKQTNTSSPCTLPHLSSHSSLVENWF